MMRLGVETKELSVQEMLDCSFDASGCSGGDLYEALASTVVLGGLSTEQLYPYEAATGACRKRRDLAVVFPVNVTSLAGCDELSLRKVLADFGPVAVSVNIASNRFMFYKSGVFYDPTCKSDLDHLNHSMLLVGYGSEPNGNAYWVLVS